MSMPLCRTAADAWQAGYEAGAASLPVPAAELAQMVARFLAASMDQAGAAPMLTVQQTAVRLGCSRRQVELMIGRGDLASVQLPGPNGPWGRRVEQAELEAFIGRHREG